MLRIAFPKIKGACSLTNVTRGFRTESHYPRGKFDKFFHIPIRAKSNSKDEGNLRRTIIEFGFKASKPAKKIDTFENTSTDEPIQKKSSAVLGTNASNGNTCERLIAKMFSNDDNDKLEQLKQDVTKTSPEDVRLEATSKDNPVYKSDIETCKPNRERRSIDSWLHYPSRVISKIGNVNITNGRNTDNNKPRRIPEVETTDMYKEREESATPRSAEEKFTQRIENIDEIPLVGGRESKVEGFNEKPKVLEENPVFVSALTGDPNIGQSNTSLEQNKQSELDRLASKIVNFPDDELDERLLKEMEKLKVSRIDDTEGGLEEAFIEKKSSKEDRKNNNQGALGEKVLEKEIIKEEGKSSTCCEDPAPAIVTKDDKNIVKYNKLDRLYPTYDGLLSDKDDLDENSKSMSYKPEIIRLHDKPLLKSGDTSYKEVINILKSEVPKIDPSQVLIDPYDKKSLVYDNDEDFKDSKQLLVTQDRKTDECDDKTSIYEQLNPNYVVTCNETCPISTIGLSDISGEQNCLKGTEVIYDEKFSQPTVTEQENKNDHKSQDQDRNSGSDDGEMTSSEPREKISSSSKKEDNDPVRKFVNMDLVKKLAQSESVINPMGDSDTAIQATEVPLQYKKLLPKLNENDLPLSELLKRVRERNRIEYCCSFRCSQYPVITNMSRCGSKPPPCPPSKPSRSKCPPPTPACPPPPPKCLPPAPVCPPPPPKCPPPPPACPKPCCPPEPKKNPCDPCQKFQSSDFFKHSILISPQILSPIYSFNSDCVLFLDDLFIRTTLNNRFSFRPQGLCMFVQEVFERFQFKKSKRRERFTRDFNPWTPIPSWPIPEKVVKRPLVCPKDGCKIDLPSPHDKPCKPHNSPKPCTSFPKRICSVADIVVFVFGERKPSFILE